MIISEVGSRLVNVVIASSVLVTPDYSSIGASNCRVKRLYFKIGLEAMPIFRLRVEICLYHLVCKSGEWPTFVDGVVICVFSFMFSVTERNSPPNCRVKRLNFEIVPDDIAMFRLRTAICVISQYARAIMQPNRGQSCSSTLGLLDHLPLKTYIRLQGQRCTI